jgi:hypothetical protein
MQEDHATTLLPKGTRLLQKLTTTLVLLEQTSALLVLEHLFPERQLNTGDPVAGRRGMAFFKVF